MDLDLCSICGDDYNKDIKHTLQCNHSFHYQCLFLTFKNMKINECPYCRGSDNLLPLINGIKKVCPNIHNITELNMISDYKSIPCQPVLKKGKNKGNECNCHCRLGYDFCTRHIKKT